MELCPEERFRQLFRQLDQEDAWVDSLPPRALSFVRKNAENKDAWLTFLAGSHVPTPPTVLPITEALLQIKDAKGAADGANTERTWKDPALENGNISTRHDGNLIQQRDMDDTNNDLRAKLISRRGSKQSSPILTASCSPLRSFQNASQGERTDLSASYIWALSALVRRRLAIASVEEQLFHNTYSALPEDDERYEVDVGMLTGDDGGYASFEELQRDDGESLKKLTRVYTLLGSDEDEELAASEEAPGPTSSRDRKSTPLKRPRSSSSGLSEHLETFIRGLRDMCERHRDAAQEESDKRKDVPKNIHRKAVSAANVVEELKEFEQRVRSGKIERVEDCISRVSACIRNQNETFKDVVAKIEERADVLREEFRERKDRINAITKMDELTTGVLGVDSRALQSMFLSGDGDVEMSEAAATIVPPRNSGKQPGRKVHIPFSEEDLRCWPAVVSISNVSPQKPRVPSFYDGRYEDYPNQEDEADSPKDNIVAMLGVDNPVMKNAIAWRRVHRLREQAVANLDMLKRKTTPRGAPGSKPNAAQKPTQNGTSIKAEDVLISQHKHTSGRSVGSGSINTERKQSVPQALREYEIRNDAYREDGKSSRKSHVKESKERALAKAVVSLICVHEGYTHSSSLALEILSDVLEDFIYLIGVNLSGCRVNIDRQEPRNAPLPRLPSEDEKYERMRLICSSGFQGNYPELEQYVRSDIPRLEQTLQESEAKLRVQIAQIEQELEKVAKNHGNTVNPDSATEGRHSNGRNQINGKAMDEDKDNSNPQSQEPLHENAFIFGHLSDHVTLDVLGSLKVPRELATPASEASYHASRAARRNKGHRGRR